MEILNAKVMVDKQAFSNFWNAAAYDSEAGRETGALLRGSFNGNYLVNGVWKTFRGMTEKELKKKYSNLESIYREDGNNMIVPGAVKIEPAPVVEYYPNGPIIGDIHTHSPKDLIIPQFSPVDIERGEKKCGLLANMKGIEEYDYLSLVTHYSTPDTKLLWDTLFSEIGKSKCKSDIQSKKDFFDNCRGNRKLEILKGNLTDETAAEIRNALKTAERTTAYYFHYGTFSEPYLMQPSVENYRKVISKAKEIYQNAVGNVNDFPKNKLLNLMQERDFLRKLHLHEIVENNEYFNMIVKPMIFHTDEKSYFDISTTAVPMGAATSDPAVEYFLKSYKKKFDREYAGGHHGIMTEGLEMNKEERERIMCSETRTKIYFRNLLKEAGSMSN